MNKLQRTEASVNLRHQDEDSVGLINFISDRFFGQTIDEVQLANAIDDYKRQTDE